MDKAEAFDQVAQGHFIVGAGSLVAGGLLYFLSSDDGFEHQRLSITPSLKSGQAGLTGSFTF